MNIKKIFFIIFYLTLVTPANATIRYMAMTGNDTGECTDINSPCETLQYCMTIMKSSDTLIIDDGNYTTSKNSITSTNFPPSGSPGAFTTIKAKHIPGQNGVPVGQPLRVKFTGAARFFDDSGTHGPSVSYVKFEGIRWNGIDTSQKWDHIYFKQVASQGVQDGNSAAFTITGQYNLLEDCVAFGKGRYKFLFYDYSRELQTRGPGNNVCRRCVARQDWAKKEDATGDPIATFVSYFNRGTAFLNCIDIDSNIPEYWMNSPGELAGAFYQPVDGGPHNMTVSGSIVINSAMGVAFSAAPWDGVSNSLNKFSNIAAVHVAGGMRLRNGADVNGVTMLDVDSNQFNYRSSTQRGQINQKDQGINGYENYVNVRNSIFRHMPNQAPLRQQVTGKYIDTFDVAPGGIVVSSLITSDPYLHGLKYPVRIETTSPDDSLATSGEAGSQIGARIVNRIGKDGTFKNDPEWDTEQGPLWPWPLEGWIRAEMRTSDYNAFCAPYVGTPQACPPSYPTDAFRGFCADGQTLTNYIFSFLGNQPPPFINAIKVQ